MSATRYSGRAKIAVTYKDATPPHTDSKGKLVKYHRDHYRVSVSVGKKKVWSGIIYPTATGFGPGVGLDSPRAYDEIATSALAFADSDVRGLSDDFRPDARGERWAVTRVKRRSNAAQQKPTPLPGADRARGSSARRPVTPFGAKGRAYRAWTKHVQGSGPWGTYHETGSGDDVRSNIHRFTSRARARISALQLQRAVGGYVSVTHNGNEVDSVGPRGASWARGGTMSPP